MTMAFRRWLVVFPLAAMIGLVWCWIELAQRLTTYYVVMSAIPIPAVLILLGYMIALIWHDGASPIATKRS
ncbi:MAG TPA: hypothetical protein VGE52_05840 [Pirellulales bacterium]